MVEAAASEHWIVAAARRAGLIAPGALLAGDVITVASAWAAIGSAAGVDESRIARILATELGLPVADLSSASAGVAGLIPALLAHHASILPLRVDGPTLVLATADPLNIETEQNAAFAAGRPVRFEIAGPHAIQQAVAMTYDSERAIASLLADAPHAAAVDVRVVTSDGAMLPTTGESDTPAVRQLTSLGIREALKRRATDIHLEPREGVGLVRFRVDGVLQEFMRLPLPVLNRVVAYLKIVGNLDMADHLRPHDGRASVAVDGHTYDLRFSTVPTRDAEKMVVRILDPTASWHLEGIGFEPRERERVDRLLTHRHGIIILTGPTGSGKTTTLYAALQRLATNEANVITIEDPIEYRLAAVTQIQVEPLRGVTFASILRSVLRQDPDIIFVGEIRDLETAELAIQASMTGHLVLTTLHANDAVGVVSRLVDLGIRRSDIAESLRGAISQRLLRRVCATCARPIAPAELTDDERRSSARFGVTPIVRAIGCEECAHTGYRGRFLVAEVLEITPSVGELIHSGASATQIMRTAVQGGMQPLEDTARERVRRGETTLDEVERELGAPTDARDAALAPEPLVPIASAIAAHA